MKMAVICCGLIGGSMALSWKRAGIVDEVIAFGHNPATLQKALDKGAADTVTTSMEEAVKDADIVVSAVPPTTEYTSCKKYLYYRTEYSRSQYSIPKSEFFCVFMQLYSQ